VAPVSNRSSVPVRHFDSVFMPLEGPWVPESHQTGGSDSGPSSTLGFHLKTRSARDLLANSAGSTTFFSPPYLFSAPPLINMVLFCCLTSHTNILRPSPTRADGSDRTPGSLVVRKHFLYPFCDVPARPFPTVGLPRFHRSDVPFSLTVHFLRSPAHQHKVLFVYLRFQSVSTKLFLGWSTP